MTASRRLALFLLLVLPVTLPAADRPTPLPDVPEGFTVELFARDPMVQHPVSMCFDARGRLFVGGGPQFRHPKPDTPPDSIKILLDTDGDGRADKAKIFATGFNCIQSMAWKGNDLWVANSPDLTIVRDLDGDDEADEYVLVYTDLGNLEHALHGLNWGPDGKLYMSKGNSKGLTKPGRIAPKPFRDLWGVKAPEGSPDLPPLKVFKKGEYKKAYHNPADDWGRTGGVLRCDDLGKNLEIVCRGLRNPWDISFDTGFHFLGTDNDQTGGDKLFAPFHGAHFGWGHSWSFNWLGEDHLPTAPASGPLFEGSGTGVIHYSAAHFPESHRGVFFVADWLRQRVDVYRPEWRGARLMPAGGIVEPFASKGKALFKPTDIEVAPDGSLYVLGWGGGYGATFDKQGNQSDQGRVYRIRAKNRPLVSNKRPDKPHEKWSFAELVADLGQHVPVWRVNAQNEIVRRGAMIREDLLKLLERDDLSEGLETWTLWTLGQIALEDVKLDAYFAKQASSAALNRRLQSLRILARRQRATKRALPAEVAKSLQDTEPRVRLEAVLALRLTGQTSRVQELLALAAREEDRIVFHACWGALGTLMTPEEIRPLLKDERGGVRRAALLALAETGNLKREEVMPFRLDGDPATASLATLWLDRNGVKLPPLLSIDPPGVDFAESVEVTVRKTLDDATIRYTLDGSIPTPTSPAFEKSITLKRTGTVKALLFKEGRRVGPIVSAGFRRLTDAELRRRLVYNLRVGTKNRYQVVERGLGKGARVYTDRPYKFVEVPAELAGASYIMTANNDENYRDADLLRFELTRDATLYIAHDVRTQDPPDWMKVGQPDGFRDAGQALVTSDHKMKLYRKDYKAGPITLGGGHARSNYIVVLRRPALKPRAKATVLADVTPLLGKGNAERGAALFFDQEGVGCFRCHRINNLGNTFAPDLSDVGQRASAEEVLRSILEPNALIVEGFRTHVIETAAGKIHTGTVLTETGLELKLLQQDGQLITIDKKTIAERTSLNRSIMPDNFGLYLDKQQLADLVAFLRSQQPALKNERKPGEPGASATGGSTDLARESIQPPVADAPGSPKKSISFEEKPSEVIININDRPIASYVFKDAKIRRPFLAHIKTPGGKQVSRNHPPEKGDPRDHDTMHPGIWLGFGDINRTDFWRNKGTIAHDRLVVSPETSSLTATSKFLADGKAIGTQTCKYTFVPRAEGVLVLIDVALKSDTNDLDFGAQEEMGLGIRLATPLTVKEGGRMLDSEGRKNEKGIWGKRADWCDYSGVVDGRRQGMMILVDPKNPAWMHARDYGVLVANPFGPRAGGKSRRLIKKGETLRLRFGVLAYEVPEEKPIDYKKVYQAGSGG